MMMCTRFMLGSSLLLASVSTTFAASMDKEPTNPFEEVIFDPLPPLKDYVEICGQFEQEKVKGVFGSKISQSKYSGTIATLSTNKPVFPLSSKGYFIIPGMNAVHLDFVIRTIRCNRSPDIVLKNFSEYLDDIDNDDVRYDFATTCLHELHLFDACNPGPEKKPDCVPEIFAKNKSEVKVGRYIRVKDKYDKWYPAKILSLESQDRVKVSFHGWASKWDSVVSLSGASVEYYADPQTLLKDREWFKTHPLKGFQIPQPQNDSHRRLYNKLLQDYPNPEAESIFWDEWDQDGDDE